MLSIEKLREYGADVDEGLTRCLGNEAFYLQLCGMMLKDDNLQKLEEALAANDLDKAFEAAHALKGVAGNLSLTPIYEPAAEITELLRSRTQMDYSEMFGLLKEREEAFRRLSE
ncbi:MAG: Hpt domain-containing protein [Erysipelotrichaceae bacterium]|nr:Hpt domain-containing protein [Erysipelotrichaceae bacterium]